MAQPPTYIRQTSFTGALVANPTAPFPVQSLDTEFNTVKTTLDATLANLALIQRDDGQLRASAFSDALETAVDEAEAYAAISVTAATSATTSANTAASLVANPSGMLVTATGGAASATLANRFSHLLNVKDDFGATGDGTTDDAAAFTAALATGQSILVPKPSVRYRVTGTLSLVTGGALLGDGSYPEIKLDSAIVSRLFDLNGVTGATVSGLTLDGNNTVTPSTDFIRLTGATNCVLSELRIVNAPGTNTGSVVVTGASTGNRIEHCILTNGEGSAIGLSGASVRGNAIIGAVVTNYTGFGIRIGDGAYQNVVDRARTHSNSIELVGITGNSFENRVIGCHAEGCGDNGISISGYRNTVTGNVSIRNQKAGIWSWGSFNTITGNVCVANNLEALGNNWAGIGVSANYGNAGQNNTITGNVCDDDQTVPTQWNGVRISGSAYVLWAPGQSVVSGTTYRYYGLNIYVATATGITGATAPVHTTGTVTDGTVTWRYSNSFITEAETIGNIVVGNRVVRSASGNYFDAASSWAKNTLLSMDETSVGGLSTTTNTVGRVTAGKELRVGATAAASYAVAALQQAFIKAPAATDAGVLMESTTNSVFSFGNGTSVLGSLTYNIASNYFEFKAGGTARLRLSGSNIRPLTDLGLVLGDPSFRWSATYTQNLHVSGNVGFYGTTPVAKPTISGSRGGNAALADLITKLAAFGLLTDGTTA